MFIQFHLRNSPTSRQVWTSIKSYSKKFFIKLFPKIERVEHDPFSSFYLNSQFSLHFLKVFEYFQHKHNQSKQMFFGSDFYWVVTRCSMSVLSIILLLYPQMTISKLMLQRLQSYSSAQILEKLMYTLNLYSDEEKEEEKNRLECPESPSPTPSPQPSNSYLQFTSGNTTSTENDAAGLHSATVKGSRRGRKNSEQVKNVNRGHWSTQENKKYHWFLQIHYAHFVNRHMRRMDKIFKTMELFIGTRQAEQCRSHHQKMEKKYLNFATIIANLRQQHYNSVEIEPILEELSNQGMSACDGLVSMEYLTAQQSVDPVVWQYKQRKKSACQKVQVEEEKEMREQEYVELNKIEEEKQNEVCNLINMLEDDHINIGELSLIHEKEENSSIFNSIFL